jgi:hypothetical protein
MGDPQVVLGEMLDNVVVEGLGLTSWRCSTSSGWRASG